MHTHIPEECPRVDECLLVRAAGGQAAGDDFVVLIAHLLHDNAVVQHQVQQEEVHGLVFRRAAAGQVALHRAALVRLRAVVKVDMRHRLLGALVGLHDLLQLRRILTLPLEAIESDLGGAPTE